MTKNKDYENLQNEIEDFAKKAIGKYGIGSTSAALQTAAAQLISFCTDEGFYEQAVEAYKSQINNFFKQRVTK